MNVQMLLIDPQNDFCVADGYAQLRANLKAAGVDQQGVDRMIGQMPAQQGSLVVGGAHEDMKRVAKMIGRIGSKINDIWVTLDSHQRNGIERPGWFKNAKDGSPTPPFTVLGLDSSNRIVAMRPDNGVLVPTDVEYITATAALYEPARKYLKALKDGGRYPHCIWTKHCVVGTWGWLPVPEISEALNKWEDDEFQRVNWVIKGNNPETEHFSAVMAEVPDPADNSTKVNTRLMETLEQADIIWTGGEALSHCLANTGRDIARLFTNPKYVQKLVLCTDACSSVGGFEHLGAAYIKDMVAMGMQTTTTTTFLA